MRVRKLSATLPISAETLADLPAWTIYDLWRARELALSAYPIAPSHRSVFVRGALEAIARSAPARAYPRARGWAVAYERGREAGRAIRP